MFEKLANGINLKSVYFIIFVLLVVFIYLTTQNFYLTKNRLQALATENRNHVTKEIKDSIFSMIKDKIKNLENSVKFLTISSLNSDPNELNSIINIFFSNGIYFDSVQIYINDRYFFAKTINNQSTVHKNTAKYEVLKKRSWYKNTINSNKTTITAMNPHELLNEKTLNICTPIRKLSSFDGVLCGVIRISSFFKIISQTINYRYGIDYFISDKNGNILKTSNLKTQKAWQDRLKEEVLKSYFKDYELELNEYFVKVYPFEGFDWQIGVGVKKNSITQNTIEKFMKISTALFFIFIFLVFAIILTYIFLQKKVKQRDEEYEHLLSHKSRMNEIGELISSINHQLTQPINSLNLLLSNTIFLSNNNILDKKTLQENLKLCNITTDNMTQTIEIFKNFYRNSENITTFSLYESIKNVIHLMHTELCKKNITIDFNNTKNIKITSIENFLQQILLVLIQNSKDALSSLKDTKKNIHINANFKDNKIEIEVIDCGLGVPNEIKNTLFSKIKTSKDASGSGIGLYFSKKLAIEKLDGDLILKSIKNPTIFSLNISSNLEKKG